MQYKIVNAIEVIKSSQFKGMPFEVLLTFLESVDIHAPEIDLFLQLWSGATSRFELFDITKSIFRSIRYPLISKHNLICVVK